MKFLMDTSPNQMQDYVVSKLVCGQLCTPLTNYQNWEGAFAIDNGAYTGLNLKAYFRLLEKHLEHKDNCLFVTVPDIVGSAKRTIELYYEFTTRFCEQMAPWTKYWALVAQDGIEDLRIQWNGIHHLFIGGTTEWKDSHAAADIVKTAKALDIPVHIGRVNTLSRYWHFTELGADTCDGSGVVRFSHMLKDIEAGIRRKEAPTLFDEIAEKNPATA